MLAVHRAITTPAESQARSQAVASPAAARLRSHGSGRGKSPPEQVRPW
jgi:hypothetical protein